MYSQLQSRPVSERPLGLIRPSTDEYRTIHQAPAQPVRRLDIHVAEPGWLYLREYAPEDESRVPTVGPGDGHRLTLADGTIVLVLRCSPD